ncbi:MAG: hypothetical protein U0359_12000 [Byssovorax sp.]
MKRYALVLVVLSLLGACGSSVETPSGSTSTTTGTGGGSSSTSTGAGGGCAGPPVQCAQFCGSDFFPAEASCMGSAWVCPPDTVDPATCPEGTCWGLALPCEKCGDAGWECAPSESCLGNSCAGVVCAECPAGGPSSTIIGACACACDASGQYSCALAGGCCNTDMDCGDAVFVPCVNHVCKQPVDGGCWADAECPPDQKCKGATVCPCSADCDVPDQPGTCAPG